MHKRSQSGDNDDGSPSVFGLNHCSSLKIMCGLLILFACLWGLEETPSANLGFKTCSGLVWIYYNNAHPFCSSVGEVEHEGNVGTFCSSTL